MNPTSPNLNRQTYREPSPESSAAARPADHDHDPGYRVPDMVPAAAPVKAPVPPPPEVPSDTAPVRPLRRPPLAVLQVFDDGGKSAELVRLRQASFVIGRTDGDLLLGHDPLLSGRHAELVRVCQAGHYAWLLRDLGSTNGSFVRVKGLALKEDMEVLISRNRIRFVNPSQEAVEDIPEDEPAAPANVRRTIDWQSAPIVQPMPTRPYLLELLQTGEGRRFPLRDEGQFVGRDPCRCHVALPEDETMDPCHAKIFRDAQGRWQLEDCNSLNGVWLRVNEITLGPQSSFLLGEQVFALAIP